MVRRGYQGGEDDSLTTGGRHPSAGGSPAATVIEAAEAGGWTEDQIRGLLADNFRQVYLTDDDD